jgi:two-component system, OmpR family, phosphate regulon sensor histidine kinase PhoR
VLDRKGTILTIAAGGGLAGCAVLLALSIFAGARLVWFGVLASSALVAVATAAAVWQVEARSRRRAIDRITEYLRALAETDTPPAMDMPAEWAAPVLAAVDAVRRARAAAQSNAASPRDADLRRRLVEAERQHIEAILSAVSDAIIVTNSSNEVAAMNETAARMLGIDRGNAVHRPVGQVVTDAALVQLMEEARRTDAAIRHSRIESGRDASGRTRSLDVTLAKFFDADGPDRVGSPGRAADAGAAEAPGVVAVLRDDAHDRQVADLKADFVSSVSHELRTPLASIKGYLEMLMDGEARDDSTRNQFYNVILTETNRLSRLIENILNISWIESGLARVHRERLSPRALVREALEVVRPQARAKQIELAESGDVGPAEVFADRDMLSQAVLNLLSNAIKYTPTGGRITVSLSADPAARTVDLAVTDTGVGVPADDLPRIFDKFYRVSTHKKMAQGTGLGLNLVKHIVQTVHGGKAFAQSEPNQGARLTIRLPMAAAEPEPQLRDAGAAVSA